jgi:type IX secretion system PorP/SprF family membrane protein
MRIKFVILSLLIFTLVNIKVTGQQLPLYSQYMFNKFLINPATAGLDGYTSVNLTAREQWLGLADAPKTHSVSAQTRLLKGTFILSKKAIRKVNSQQARDSRVGLGINIFNDKNGLVNRTGAQISYAYHIQMDESNLSFGLAASFFQFSIDKSKMKLLEEGDELIDNSDLSMFMPDLNFGIFYSTRNYYGGFSIEQLTQSSIQFGSSNYNDYRLFRQFNFMGGYRYDINREYSLEPNILVKFSGQNRLQLDLNTKLYIQNNYWAGLSFRTGSAFIIMGGVSLDKYHFGYAFDYNFNSIRKHSFGSHEFMVAIKFGDNARRFRWLRSF